jgi:hypothetical protein
MTEATADLVLIQSWRLERAALQKKLARLCAGDREQTLTLSQKFALISQLKHTIVEYEVFINEYSRDGCAPISFAPVAPHAPTRYQTSLAAA